MYLSDFFLPETEKESFIICELRVNGLPDQYVTCPSGLAYPYQLAWSSLNPAVSNWFQHSFLHSAAIVRNSDIGLEHRT